MVRYISLLLFIGLAWGQSKMDINNLIDRGGVLYAPNKEKPFSGSVFDLYDNGQKKLNGRYRNGNKNGKWTWWNEEGGTDSTGSYKNGLMNGIWQFYNRVGGLKGKGLYKNGEKEGKWNYWYEKGQKRSEITYKDGKIISDKAWDENGNVVEHPIKLPKEQLMSDALLGQALVALEHGDTKNAQFQLESILSEYSGLESAQIAGYLIGKIMYAIGDYKSAEIYLSQYLSDQTVDILMPSTAIMLADISVRNGDTVSALSYLDTGMNWSKGKHGKRNFNLEKANLYYKQGNIGDAKHIAGEILSEKDLTPIQKKLAEELLGKIIG